ncbi:unnamed protein product [Polarella glacialis]|uniref:FHA domain-containing protein n=1 Tax=Polarella glacialis TaxID=89957 RepID=A0A813LL51_POLGL|nr:unnamed protein product [Polarella glacialis]CAE8736872.1 unnamed protein product [Polarella glacialis]
MALTVTLVFSDGDEGPRTFELEPGEKDAITVGRAPKSDIVCLLSGVSWNHLELKLLPPQPDGAPNLVLKDLSMNGTGLESPGDHKVRKIDKETETPLSENAVVWFPLKKPKAKAEIIQQSFIVRFGLEQQESVTKKRVSWASVVAQPSVKEDSDEAPRKRQAVLSGEEKGQPRPAALQKAGVADVQEDSSRFVKGESLLRSAREAELGGRATEAFDAYRRGLQHMIKGLPSLKEDDPQVKLLQKTIMDSLERAAKIKQRFSLSKAQALDIDVP